MVPLRLELVAIKTRAFWEANTYKSEENHVTLASEKSGKHRGSSRKNRRN